MWSILANVSQSLDPSGTLLPSWATGSLQPCYWASQPGGPLASATPRAGYGGPGGFAGLTCSNANTATGGGIATIVLNVQGLNGSLPAALYKLKTVTQIQARLSPCGVSGQRQGEEEGVIVEQMVTKSTV